MRVRDLMTRTVVSVPPDTPAPAIARLLSERRISAVPVTDGWGMLLGIVSATDLVRRLAADDTAPGRSLLQSLFFDRDRAAALFARAHGATAGELMTHDPVTATEEMPAERAAHLLDQHRVRQLPVVQDGVLVGIVTRGDLLQALLAPPGDTSDAAIRAALAAALARHPWADAPFVFADVAAGKVVLYGFCHSAAVRRGLVALARDLPGVVAVEDRITDARPRMVA